MPRSDLKAQLFNVSKRPGILVDGIAKAISIIVEKPWKTRNVFEDILFKECKRENFL